MIWDCCISGAAGIYGSEYNTIRHCEIHDTTYCAINDIETAHYENNMIWNINSKCRMEGLYTLFLRKKSFFAEMLYKQPQFNDERCLII